MPIPQIDIPHDRIADFCRKWKIVELSLFGSVLRDDFGPDSDVDVLVTFEAGFYPGIDEYIEMVAGLRELFGREVDLVNKRSLRNPFLRYEVLTTRQVIHAA